MASSTDLQVGGILRLGTDGESTAASGSEIVIEPVSVDAAIARVDALQGKLHDVSLQDVKMAWSGPGCDAVAELLMSTVGLRMSLSIMLENTAKALRDAKEQFVLTDERLAAGLGALGSPADRLEG